MNNSAGISIKTHETFVYVSFNIFASFNIYLEGIIRCLEFKILNEVLNFSLVIIGSKHGMITLEYKFN